jgi:hypothetical protein
VTHGKAAADGSALGRQPLVVVAGVEVLALQSVPGVFVSRDRERQQGRAGTDMKGSHTTSPHAR